jgi:hypothetical protein
MVLAVHLLYTQAFNLSLMIPVVLLRTTLTTSTWRIHDASIKDPIRRSSLKHLKSDATSRYVQSAIYDMYTLNMLQLVIGYRV